ncbi:hypothetical protein BGZ95_009046, partial [Linnemannia exigua]
GTTGKNTKASSSSTDATITTATPSPPTVDTKGKSKGPKVLVSNTKEALSGAAQTTEDHLYSKKTKTNYKGQ